VNKLSSLIPADAERAFVVTQVGVNVSVDPGIPYRLAHVPDGEEAKILTTVENLCSSFAKFGITRRDIIIGVGGGVVTDVAGFAASVYHRGVRVIHVATTLLAQIDAAIGGKTGVNLPEGKNLVGTFWQPSGVICDTSVLDNLPEREMVAAMGELAKYHFLGGGQLDKLPLDQRIAACIQIKADVVAADEREGAGRALLNYGHTLGHALEIAGSFDLRHGEAVAIGLKYAALLALTLGRIDEERVAAHQAVLDAYSLSSVLPPEANHEDLVDLCSKDKKALDGFTFVLDSSAGLEVVSGIPREALLSALKLMEIIE
jgi:5-deoxy-5-amino-3-dehydroquinate synthase